MQKLPPYGRPLSDLLSQGLKPNNCVWLYIGLNAWTHAQDHRINLPRDYVLALPAWTEPAIYSWPVSHCKIVIQTTSYSDPDYIADLVYCLFKDGASSVFCISIDSPFGKIIHKLTIYHKD